MSSRALEGELTSQVYQLARQTNASRANEQSKLELYRLSEPFQLSPSSRLLSSGTGRGSFVKRVRQNHLRISGRPPQATATSTLSLLAAGSPVIYALFFSSSAQNYHAFQYLIMNFRLSPSWLLLTLAGWSASQPAGRLAGGRIELIICNSLKLTLSLRSYRSLVGFYFNSSGFLIKQPCRLSSTP